MMQAQIVLEEEMRALRTSRLYRPHDNEGKRADFSETIIGTALQFHL